MIKIVCYLVTLGFLFLSPVHSYYTSDVPADFNEMLAAPTTFRPSTGTSLPTKVTAPFVKNVAPPSLDLFSNPTAAAWKTQNSGIKLNPHQILDVIGKSRRGLLNSLNPLYQNITNAETTGLLAMIQGKAFRLRQAAATPAQQEEMARELLNIGYQMPSAELARILSEFERIYNSGGLSSAQKSHIQTSAMLVLKGNNSALTDRAWYLAGRDKVKAIGKIDTYAAKFLPVRKAVGGTGGAVDATEVHFNPAEIHLKHLRGRSFLYGTDDVQPSKIHADGAGPRFLNIMGLGTIKTPANTQSVDDVCSIVASVSDTHSIVITSLPDLKGPDDAFVLLPAYGEIDASKTLRTNFNSKGRRESEVLQGNVSVSLSSQFVNPLPIPITWSTTYADNNGRLTFKKASPEAFSLTATVSSPSKRPKISYYLRIPIGVKMTLKTFSERKGGDFNLLELLDEITSSISDPSVLAELQQIKSGHFPKNLR
ncbi:MAG: hypothetical protein K2Q34_02680 [Alphaproteobacteria bacterium]|nr:hypothetical protein [Alphaproteobacteria bacterium]